MARKTVLTILFVSFYLPTLGQDSAGDRDWNAQLQRLSFLQRTDIGDYVLGPGDVIEISVFAVEQLNRSVRISSSGSITLPFLGKVDVAGLTGAELELTLTELLIEHELVRDPQVSIYIREYRSQPVYVLGAVRQPGQYTITQQINLIDVIAMAGGLHLDRAADYALFHRRTKENEPSYDPSDDPSEEAAGNEDPGTLEGISEPVRIDLKDLLERGNIAWNIPVRGGDVIHVPERDIHMFYVIGEVGRPGAYEIMPEQEQIFVSQALAWAGGPRRTAKSDKGVLVRHDREGGRQELAVNFDAILKGRVTDFPVHADDIIFIPGSNIKTIGYGLLGVVPGTVSSTIVWGARRSVTR